MSRKSRVVACCTVLFIIGIPSFPVFAPGYAEARNPQVSLFKNNRVYRLDLEDYVGGVLLGEVSPSWPHEALKAMAVCARTFVLHRIRSGQVITATVSDQVYRKGYRDYDTLRRAVSETAGEVLTFQGELAQVFYHAHSGGTTADSSSTWGGQPLPYLRGITDHYSLQAENFADWEYEVGSEQFLRQLGEEGLLSGVTVMERDRCNRVLLVAIILGGGRVLHRTGRELREQVFSPNEFRSTNFTVEVFKDRVKFTGRGWGHGVGLSQWGAWVMAGGREKRFDYREILRFYFPDTEISVIGEDAAWR